MYHLNFQARDGQYHSLPFTLTPHVHEVLKRALALGAVTLDITSESWAPYQRPDTEANWYPPMVLVHVYESSLGRSLHAHLGHFADPCAAPHDACALRSILNSMRPHQAADSLPRGNLRRVKGVEPIAELA